MFLRTIKKQIFTYTGEKVLNVIETKLFRLSFHINQLATEEICIQGPNIPPIFGYCIFNVKEWDKQDSGCKLSEPHVIKPGWHRNVGGFLCRILKMGSPTRPVGTDTLSLLVYWFCPLGIYQTWASLAAILQQFLPPSFLVSLASCSSYSKSFVCNPSK